MVTKARLREPGWARVYSPALLKQTRRVYSHISTTKKIFTYVST